MGSRSFFWVTKSNIEPMVQLINQQYSNPQRLAQTPLCLNFSQLSTSAAKPYSLLTRLVLCGTLTIPKNLNLHPFHLVDKKYVQNEQKIKNGTSFLRRLHQYRRNLGPCLGEGRCSSSCEVLIFFQREGRSSILRATVLLSAFSVYFSDSRSLLLLFWLPSLVSFSLSLLMYIFCLSTRCMASLYFFFHSSTSCSRLSSLPIGISSCCSISTIFLQACTSFPCFSSSFFRSISFSSSTFLSLALSLLMSSLSSAGFPIFLVFSISSSMRLSLSLPIFLRVLISVFISSSSPSFFLMMLSRSITLFSVIWYDYLDSYSRTVFCSRSIILQAF